MSGNEALPLVSIIIPVYNGSDYLREAIDSALRQTYRNLEILVINDGSTDDGATERIALSYGDKIHYISKPNGGVSSALNTGIRHMKGEYFSWLSHDDTYTPDKVARQVRLLMQANDPRAVALCDYRQIDKNSNFLADARRSVLFQKSCVLNWQEALIGLFKQGCYNGCAFLIPKKVFDECGGFHEGLRYSQDILMWIQIFLHKYSLIYGDQADISNRIHDKQMTQTAKALYHSDSKAIADLVIPALRDGSDERYALLYHYAKSSAVYQNTDVVKDCFAAAKQKKLFTGGQIVSLWLTLAYGNIRPLIRKVYYSLLKKVKTQ
jgi:glycosyltransferase involved in cell wall biosynthesis